MGWCARPTRRTRATSSPTRYCASLSTRRPRRRGARLLHRRIAASLPRRGETAALTAQQLRLAGEPREAAEEFRIAAEHAASLLAHADAIAHLDTALALDPPDAAGLHERIGDLRTLVGDYGGALASYESAAAESQGSTLAALEQKLGGVHGRRGDWERSEARLAAALDSVPPGDSGLRARIVADLALSLHHSGRTDDAAARAGEARALAEAAADRLALAQAHNMLGVLARTDGDRRRRERSSSAASRWPRSSTTRRPRSPRSTTSRWPSATPASSIERSS